ncbi:hypothetical protein EMIT0196P_150112 [Pseudomonas chlororaphis]
MFFRVLYGVSIFVISYGQEVNYEIPGGIRFWF